MKKLWAWLTALVTAGGSLGAEPQEITAGIFQVGVIDHPMLRECSGVAACRSNTNLVWMHSDGRRPVLYAVSRGGKSLREYLLDAPGLADWEDIATDGAGRLFVADIGNNEAKRDQLAVYAFDEPDPAGKDGLLRTQQAWQLRFPGKPFDCEAFFVWKDHGYLVSKVFNDQKAGLYRFPLAPASGAVTLESLGNLPVTSPVTGADISPDGGKLALAAKSGVFLFDLTGEVPTAVKVKPRQAKFKDKHIEGICFVPEGLLVTAETRAIYLFVEKAFGKPKKQP